MNCFESFLPFMLRVDDDSAIQIKRKLVIMLECCWRALLTQKGINDHRWLMVKKISASA